VPTIDTANRTDPGIGQYLAAVRRERGLSQTEFARRCGLARQEVAYFETNARKPSVKRLLQIAKAFDLPFQRFLSGGERPGRGLKDIAIELHSLGLIDLWVAAPSIPGAFRRCEEVVALAVAGKEPPPRIIEGVPAVLAWNRWNGAVLRAFAREAGRATAYRLAWLADVALALERQGGFPGDCPGKESLAAFVKLIRKPPSDRWDSLGHPTSNPPASPVWKRWRINYAATLDTFRQRAELLVSLAKAEGRAFPWQR
jgi:transcriptional regulator with XRE-family HTH domain